MNAPALSELQAARQQLQTRGWITRRNESFHHLPPPNWPTWVGAEPNAEAALADASESGWQVQALNGGTPDARVQAKHLNALQPEQRRQLLAGLPDPADDRSDAAPFAWAHRALCRQGLRIQVSAGAQDAPPVALHLSHRAQAGAHAPLLVLELAPGTQCVLLETHDWPQADSAQNLQVHLRLGAGAQLQHLRVAAPEAHADGTHCIAHHVHAQLDAQAHYAQALVGHGASYHLQRAAFELQDHGAEVRQSAVLLNNGQGLDHQAYANHATGHTVSKLESLHLASGSARSVANAYTRIAPGADNADVFQRLWGVALAGAPRLIQRPHLEILHDQVQGAHGATWGKLPADALFYAAQRGIDPVTAQRLIVEGMAHAVLARALEAEPDSASSAPLLAQWLDSAWLTQAIARQLESAHG